MWGLWIALGAVVVVVVLIVRLGVPAARRGISSMEAGGLSRSGKPLNPLSWIEGCRTIASDSMCPKRRWAREPTRAWPRSPRRSWRFFGTGRGCSCQHPPGGEQVSRNLRKQVDCQPLRPDAPGRGHHERDAADRGLGASRSGAGEAGGTGRPLRAGRRLEARHHVRRPGTGESQMASATGAGGSQEPRPVHGHRPVFAPDRWPWQGNRPRHLRPGRPRRGDARWGGGPSPNHRGRDGLRAGG